MKLKILMIGNFGYYENRLNGQTMRTRSVYDFLSNEYCSNKFDVSFIDTSSTSKMHRIINYFKFIVKYFFSSSIVILPAQRAVRYILPMLSCLNCLVSRHVHYVVIGGWIADYLESNKKSVEYVKDFKGLYVQTHTLKKRLEKIGLNNVFYFPNFRIYSQSDKVNNRKIDKVKELVFYSRVAKDKGIEIAIDSVGQVNKDRREIIKLSIYGPVESDYKNKFDHLVKTTNNISYKGVLESDKVLQTLSSYDLLLFPTYYEGEGFPGAILDAMSAGVPVIASNWKYNSEVISDGKTGILFKAKSTQDLISKLNMVLNRSFSINDIKANCFVESKKYAYEKVGKTLIKNILKYT